MAKANVRLVGKVPSPRMKVEWGKIKNLYNQLQIGRCTDAIYNIHRTKFVRAFPERIPDLIRLEKPHSSGKNPTPPGARVATVSRGNEPKRSTQIRKPDVPTADEIQQLADLGIDRDLAQGMRRQAAITLIGNLKKGPSPARNQVRTLPKKRRKFKNRKSEPRVATDREATWLKNHLTGPFGNARKR